MNSWNGLDFIIFLIFTLNFILGMSRGTSREIISMMSLCAALIITIRFTVPLAAFCNRSPLIVDVVSSGFIQRFIEAIGIGPLTETLLRELFYAISMLVCFVGTFSICEAGIARTNLIETISFPYAALNRKIAGGLGCTRGYVISLLFLAIVSLHIFKPGNNVGDGMVSNSYFASLFRSQTIELDQLISGQNPEYYNRILNKNTFGPEQITNILQPKEIKVPEQTMQQLEGQLPPGHARENLPPQAQPNPQGQGNANIPDQTQPSTPPVQDPIKSPNQAQPNPPGQDSTNLPDQGQSPPQPQDRSITNQPTNKGNGGGQFKIYN